MKKQKKKSVILRVLKDCKKLSAPLIASCVITFISILANLYAPDALGDLTQKIYDVADGKIAPAAEFLKGCVILAALYVIISLCNVTTTLINCNTVSRHFTRDIRVSISDKITRLSIGTLDSTPNGEIIARMMNDVSTMSGTVYSLFDIVISGGIKLVLITIVLFMLDPAVAAIVIILVPASLALSAALARLSEKHFAEVRKINGSICTISEEDFTCFDTVKAFNLENKQNEEFCRRSEALCSACKKAYFLSSIVTPVITFTNAITYVVICLIGGYFAINGRFGENGIGVIIKIILYSQMLQGPLESLAGGFSMIQNTLAAARRVYDFLDSEEMPADEGVSLENVRGDVTFENVCFSYDKEKPLIQNFTAHIKAGQKVAIVGPTGGGKTTIVNLLMRFYDVDSGRILIDGVDTYTLSKRNLRSLFQMVLQDTWLFSGTIYDNVAYGKPDATTEEVENACKRAHIDGFIKSLPDGYNTIINEETTNISGGQKQLLTIARAYLTDKKLLILDEATSNVDTRTELLIQKSMDALTKGKTSFVIAHRLSTIVNADVILVINGGKIVESGTHSQLLEKHGFYYEIYQSQYAL